MNKVFVRTTKLSQSRYVNIGWCLHSHAEYSNQELARADLQQRMGKERVDFGLVPHSLSHITSDGSKITTKSMKIRADCNVRQEVFRGLLERMKLGKEDPNLTEDVQHGRLEAHSFRSKYVIQGSNNDGTDSKAK